jgi:hypothetical protein
MSLRNDIKKNKEAEADEQRICVSCGFCCDGTLFLQAQLNNGERGHLPEKIEQQSFRVGDQEWFRLPCLYFTGKCTVYDKEKADVCSAYRCQLLNDFAGGKVSLHDAIESVREAVGMRKEIMKEYQRISGNTEDINFRQLLLELGRIQKPATEKEPLQMDYEMLLARCNIFAALLIKHFRSAADFEKMMIGDQTGDNPLALKLQRARKIK